VFTYLCLSVCLNVWIFFKSRIHGITIHVDAYAHSSNTGIFPHLQSAQILLPFSAKTSGVLVCEFCGISISSGLRVV